MYIQNPNTINAILRETLFLHIKYVFLLIMIFVEKQIVLHPCYLLQIHIENLWNIETCVIRAWAANIVTISVSRGCAIASKSELACERWIAIFTAKHIDDGKKWPLAVRAYSLSRGDGHTFLFPWLAASLNRPPAKWSSIIKVVNHRADNGNGSRRFLNNH